jgi:gliding motility-associated-like protein
VYDIPQATPTTATTAVIAITGGVGQFDVPASALNLTGQHDLTITSIVSLSGGCNNTTENAQAQFIIYPVPDLNGAVLTAADICLGDDNTISINTANNLVDGNYTITYELSGASTLTNTALVAMASGQGTFLIPASEINTSGTVTVNITQIVSQQGSCSNTGAGLTPVDFDIAPAVGTPTLVDGGNKFCAPTNPTIANLTSNITGADTVLWYDAPTGGNLYVSTTSLIDGGTYYAAYQTTSGCESGARLSVTVTLDPCDDILIPDGFSPNGDTINDTFEIKNLATKYPKFKLEIYNRYGNVLYKGDINTPNWDGTNHEGAVKLGSSTLPTGVYFYILEFNDGITKDKQGRLYLSR